MTRIIFDVLFSLKIDTLSFRSFNFYGKMQCVKCNIHVILYIKRHLDFFHMYVHNLFLTLLNKCHKWFLST